MCSIPAVFSLSIIAIIYTSIACVAELDLKRVIAYSSIGHMNTSVIGMFSNDYNGITASIYFLISHGIISSALFLLTEATYALCVCVQVSEWDYTSWYNLDFSLNYSSLLVIFGYCWFVQCYRVYLNLFYALFQTRLLSGLTGILVLPLNLYAS